MKESRKWLIFALVAVLCLSVCIASVAADKCCTPPRYQHPLHPSPVYTVPVYTVPVYTAPVYTAPTWYYTKPAWQYTKTVTPVFQPVVQLGNKIYYSLTTGKYFSFSTNSLRFPVGVWWI